LYDGRFSDNYGPMSTSFMPRRCVDYNKQELASVLRMGNGYIEYVTFA